MPCCFERNWSFQYNVATVQYSSSHKKTCFTSVVLIKICWYWLSPVFIRTDWPKKYLEHWLLQIVMLWHCIITHVCNQGRQLSCISLSDVFLDYTNWCDHSTVMLVCYAITPTIERFDPWQQLGPLVILVYHVAKIGNDKRLVMILKE